MQFIKTVLIFSQLVLSVFTASATVCYSLSSIGNSLVIAVVPNSNYNTVPNNIWTTAEVTISWSSSLGTNVIQSFTAQNGFPYLSDGPVQTIDGINYKKYGFTGASYQYSLTSGTSVQVLNITVSHPSISMGDFSIVPNPPVVGGTASFTNVFGDQYAAGSCNLSVPNVPLPVELLDFTAAPGRGAVLAQWSSASETNFSGYELQRSTNARDFTKIAWVAGKGGGDYEHTDADVRPGTTYYYRLKMLDLDGSFELSRVRSAKIEAAAGKELQILPNPAFGYFKVNFETMQAGDATLELINELGQVVMSKRYQFAEGPNSIMVNSGSFPAGNYWLKIHDADGTQTGKLVIGKR